MSVQPDAVIRSWFEQAWNQKKDDTIDRLLATDVVVHGLPGGPMRGPASFRPLYDSFRGAFPDIHITVERTITQGDFVAAHCRVTGTHSGDALGVPATGRRVDFQGIVMARVGDGQLREGWNCFDFLTMYQQLGVVPPIP
jgi:steroid delta-isomerase-like uncharacterized protein